MKKKRTKVVHLLWGGGIGGTEEYVKSLVQYFDHSEYETHICFMSEKGEIYKETMMMDNIKVDFMGIKNGFDIINILRFAFYLYKKNYDILHLHMRNILSTAIICLFKTPKVLTHHLSPEQTRIHKKNKVFFWLFAGKFQKIIVISKIIRDSLIKDFKIKNPENIEVIYNGIDLNKFDRFSNIPSDLLRIKKPGKYVIGFVGRMQYFKRPDLFINVARELLERDKKFHFIMVGDGPEMEKCRDMVERYQIKEYFELLGFRRDIPNIVRSFDALLFTSVDEGFGIVLIEAMAMGVPVFAIREGAVPEIVTNKENGILLETTNPEEIAQQMLETIENNTLIEKIKEQCVEHVHSHFSIEACVNKTQKIYEEILSNANG